VSCGEGRAFRPSLTSREESSELSGDTATVRLEGANTDVRLEKEDGEWKISRATLEESFGRSF
jgi:hypothetical protein